MFLISHFSNYLIRNKKTKFAKKKITCDDHIRLIHEVTSHMTITPSINVTT